MLKNKEYAVIKWSVEDIIATAEEQGITLTEQEAATWWEEHEKYFQEALIETGNEMLSNTDFVYYMKKTVF